MRAFGTLAALVLVITVAIVWGRKVSLRKPESADIYIAMRDQALHGSRARFGLPEPSSSTEPWGVVMDWGLPEGTATMVALSDGSASVYLSTGGGTIGGGQSHEAVREAARKTVLIAREFQPQMVRVTSYTLPKAGEMQFFVLTDSGVFWERATDEDLREHRIPLAKLGDAAQEVIARYSQVQ